MLTLVVLFVCVECKRRHYELTADPNLAGATLPDRCSECVYSHETSGQEVYDER
jgi:hypothetical protein